MNAESSIKKPLKVLRIHSKRFSLQKMGAPEISSGIRIFRLSDKKSDKEWRRIFRRKFPDSLISLRTYLTLEERTVTIAVVIDVKILPSAYLFDELIADALSGAIDPDYSRFSDVEDDDV